MKDRFPDKKIPLKSYARTVEQIDRLQKFHQERSLSQDEATWLPGAEYTQSPIAITWMPDIHFGSLGVDYGALERDINIIASTPNMYVIFGGDEIDNHNAIKYPQAIWGDGVPPQEQMEAWAEMITTLDGYGKVGALVWGNHNEFGSASGINFYDTFMSDLNCPLFLDGGGVLNVVTEGATYRVGMRHTHWGNSKLNMTNAPKRMLQFGYPNLDVALTGHVHQAAGEMFVQAGEEKIAVAGGTYQLNHPRSKKWHGLPQAGGFTILLHQQEKRMGLFRSVESAQEHLLAVIQYRDEPNPYSAMIERMNKGDESLPTSAPQEE